MIDIVKDWSDKGWQPILIALKQGEHPDKKDIANRLRGNRPVPQEVRIYVAGLLDGSIKQKRGRKKKNSPIHVLRKFYAKTRYYHEREKLKHQHRAALERIGESMGVPPDTLDKWIYQRNTTKRKTE